ncbi:uncharacterized protein F5147DRAFT_773553 [Suillus discolor]|uniref:Uncharacterized protein n=1 Tax=Suillus discolor TaxID=1912936 RepID=A0A9P7F8U0_9AGAM|nr:uncharacterized protein F5147DRAFT_773553 [Suillus discolor]KAG2108749.1 hypothetical protein F5147DRAFT_773553 [Suillus discolor]
MAKRCLDVVKDFRAAKGSKFDAAYVISSIVKESLPLGSGKNPSTVAAIYLAMLDEWESEQNSAYHRASGTAGEQQSIEPACNKGETHPKAVRSQQASIDPEEPAQKWAKPNFTCLDLKSTVHENLFKPLSTNLRHTIRILQNWLKDQKQAKLKLIQSLNLDAIHTIITTLHAVKKYMEVIRDAEFTDSISEMATKKITK